jgi:hypothetical protein
VPVESQEVVTAILIASFSGSRGRRQLQLAFTDPKVSSLHAEWTKPRKGKIRHVPFLLNRVLTDEVSREMREIEPVLGIRMTSAVLSPILYKDSMEILRKQTVRAYINYIRGI